MVLCLALPNHQHPPASFDQVGIVALIPFDIACKLRTPELQPALGHAGMRASRMLMEETAIHEHRHLPGWEHEIRPSWKAFVVKPISQATGMQELPDPHLGFCVFATDEYHLGTAGEVSRGQVQDAPPARARRPHVPLQPHPCRPLPQKSRPMSLPPV